MSLQTRSPLRMLGGTNSSGSPSTGEVPWTRGGQQTATIWSGALAMGLTACPAGAHGTGNSAKLLSGGGRVSTIVVHNMLTSGQPVFIYDAAVIARSGAGVAANLIAESGARLIGFIPPRSRATLALASGAVDTTTTWQDVITLDMPFSSGLCVAAASGAPGFTLSFTPETNPIVA